MGFHVMFRDLKHPLEQGKTVKATLKFDKAEVLMSNIQSLQSAHPHPARQAGAE
jgi:copper(I)-binding protein